jgi:hypothetical protein
MPLAQPEESYALGLEPYPQELVDDEKPELKFTISFGDEYVGKFNPTKRERFIMLNRHADPFKHNPKREMTKSEQMLFLASQPAKTKVNASHKKKKQARQAEDANSDDDAGASEDDSDAEGTADASPSQHSDRNTTRVPGAIGQGGVICRTCGEASAVYKGYRKCTLKGFMGQKVDVYECQVDLLTRGTKKCQDCPVCMADRTVFEHVHHMKSCICAGDYPDGEPEPLKLGRSCPWCAWLYSQAYY